jgi:hypothetical protein
MTIMSALLAGIPDVRECVVYDVKGQVPTLENAKTPQELQLAVSSKVAADLADVSELLGLGSLEMLSITGTQPAWVVAFRLQSLIVAEVDFDHPVRKVEQALRETDWLAATEWVLSDSDIEYLPSPQLQPKEAAERPFVGPVKSHRSHA